MPTKLTQEEGIQKLKDTGFRPLEPFINAKTKILVTCKRCGKAFKVLPSAAWGGHIISCGCARRNKVAHNRLSQEEVKSRFSRRGLTIMEPYTANHIAVLIRCRCKTIFKAAPSDIFSGTTSSCGCLKRQVIRSRMKTTEVVRAELLKLGIKLNDEYHGATVKVRMICTCGTPFMAAPNQVLSGKIKGCGHQVRGNGQANYALTEAAAAYYRSTALDMETVSSRLEIAGFKAAGPYINSKTKMVVICHCGKIFNAYLESIHMGCTTSCGCLSTSAGERAIAASLQKFNCQYKAEWTREGKRARGNLRYDFYLLQHNAVIEFNGIQHIDARSKFHQMAATYNGTTPEEEFTKLQARDKEKRDWAAANGIPLLDINYDEIDQVEDKVWNFLMELRQRKISMVA